MNAAIAVHKNYVYVGSRTDGKNGNANHAGIMVVNISNPASPTVVNEMQPPLEGNPQESSRSCAMALPGDSDRPAHQLRRPTAHLCAQPNLSSMRFYESRAPTRRTRNCSPEQP